MKSIARIDVQFVVKRCRMKELEMETFSCGISALRVRDACIVYVNLEGSRMYIAGSIVVKPAGLVATVAVAVAVVSTIAVGVAVTAVATSVVRVKSVHFS